MTTYFWCSSGEDGTRIEALSETTLKRRLASVAKGDDSAEFVSAIPDEDKGCWMAPPDTVVIIKGEIIVPKEKTRVTEFEI